MERGGLLNIGRWVNRNPTWKTIHVGMYKTPDSLRAALIQKRTSINIRAGYLLRTNPLSKTVHELDLIRTSVKRLGLPQFSSLHRIYARAEDKGYGLLPSEAGPYLRLQYTDQPGQEWLIIATQSMLDQRKNEVLYHVGVMRHLHDMLYLEVINGDPSAEWCRGREFIFLRK